MGDWPNIANPYRITPEEHAAHTSIRGIPYPTDWKTGKKLLKVASKPHIKVNRVKVKPNRRRKKK